MSVTNVKLGDVCSLMTGGTPKTSIQEYYENGTIPWIVSGDLHKGQIFDCEKRITEKAVQNSNARYLPKDSVLIALNGQGKTRGTVAMLRIEGATCNQSIVSINPNEHTQLHAEYLFQYLRASYQKIRNITGDKDRAGLNMPLIRDIEIPLPSLAEQKRIAAILDKADGIRRKRQQAIDLADQFLRAIFLDMFGDPSNNQHDFNVGKIEDLLESANYGTSAKAGEIGKYPILRMGNITYDGGWNLEDLKYIDLDQFDKKKYLIRDGDLLFNRTNSKQLVGKTAVYRGDEMFAFAGYLVRSRVNDKAVPEFISGYLNSRHGKLTLQSMCKSIVGMANINAKEMQSIKILLPPVSLQKKYQKIVFEVQKKVDSFRKSGSEMERLYGSLVQGAFKGELS